MILKYFVCSFLLLCSFVHGRGQENTDIKKEELNVDFIHRHSGVVLSNNNIYSDAIRIKRNLSLSSDIYQTYNGGVPANDLYEDIWLNNRVHVYGDIKNKPDTFLVNLQTFQMPISKGYVTSKFGQRSRGMHLGIDLKVQVGDTIYAAFEGKVRVKNYERNGYGKYLVLRHPNGLETIYGHLSDYLVDVEDDVRAGQAIALGGNTGRSTGSHLHFETRFIGQPINPADLIDFENFRLIQDQYLITPSTFNLYSNYKAMRFHTIRKGDSLSKIARMHGTTIARLCRLNKITTKSTLKIGAKLRVN